MKLENIAKIRTGLALNRKRGDIHDDIYYKYRVITLKSFSFTGKLLENELDEFVANEELNPNYMTSDGDILVRLREPNIAVHIDKSKAGLTVPSLIAIIKADESVNTEYLTHFINSNLAQKRLQKEVKGTTIPMIKAKDLSELEVILPPLEIQNKIVAMLELANNEIALLEELKTLKLKFKNELLDIIIQKEINI